MLRGCYACVDGVDGVDGVEVAVVGNGMRRRRVEYVEG